MTQRYVNTTIPNHCFPVPVSTVRGVEELIINVTNPNRCFPTPNSVLLQDKAPAKKKKANGKKSSKKASFKVNGKGKGLKAGNMKADDVPMYKGTYDLSLIPVEARPDLLKPNLGKRSYTLACSNKATIEVLLRNRAYFVKKLAVGAPGPCGQVSFSRFGDAAGAWSEAKHRAGWV